MPTDVAHKRWWQIFEVIFGLPFLAAIALHLAVPLSLPRAIRTPVIIGRRSPHHRGRGPRRPGASGVGAAWPADRSRASYEHTRHDRCVLGLKESAVPRRCFRSGGNRVGGQFPLGVRALPPAFVACHYVLIAPEERYLAAKFDKEFAQYVAAVRRWLGRVRD